MVKSRTNPDNLSLKEIAELDRLGLLSRSKLKMNPILFSVGNIDWTETGRENLDNLSEAFGCDIIQFQPNRKIAKNI